MYVKNVPGTSNLDPCGCEGGWIEHWRKYSPGIVGKTLLTGECARVGCTGTDLNGAHVRVQGMLSDLYPNTYILPLCSSCNHPSNTQAFEVKVGIELAPADPKTTCQR